MSIRRSVIFDLDDTLYPEASYVLSGLHAVARYLSGHENRGLDQSQILQRLLTWHSQSPKRVFDCWRSDSDQPTIEVQQLVEVYRAHRPEIQPFPEIPAILDDLSELGYRLGLVSDGFLHAQRQKWDVLGLDNYFDAVVFSDELGREHWKPDPAPYLKVLRQLQVEPANAIYIADNPAKDFLGARRCGIASLRYRCETGIYRFDEPESAEHAADWDTDSLPQLVSIIRRWTTNNSS